MLWLAIHAAPGTNSTMLLCLRILKHSGRLCIAGTDLNGDGQPDYAACWINAQPCNTASYYLSVILASMTQTKGRSSGWLFDPDNLNNLLTSTEVCARRLESVGTGCTPCLSGAISERRLHATWPHVQAGPATLDIYRQMAQYSNTPCNLASE